MPVSFIIGLEGWEEVADYVLRWAVEHSANQAVGRDPARGR
jgi:hypothetical protein